MKANWERNEVQPERYSSQTGRSSPKKHSLEMEFGVGSQKKKPRLSLGVAGDVKGSQEEPTHEQRKEDFDEIMNLMGMDGEDFAFPEPKTPIQFEETQEDFPQPKEPMMHIDEAGLVSSVSEKYARLMIVRDAHFIQNYEL